jgi:maleamate amidohydrolase
MGAPWESVGSLYRAHGITSQGGLGVAPALLVVDMTLAFTDPDHPVGSGQADSLKSISRLLDIARPRGLPIVYTTLAYSSLDMDGATWRHKSPALGLLRLDQEAAVTINPQIAPERGDLVINKQAPSAFFGTGLVSVLIPARVDTLIVMGCSTSGCVRATVVDALSYGYRVGVPETCVADRARQPHEANLFDMNAKYADVMADEDVAKYLSSVSSR